MTDTTAVLGYAWPLIVSAGEKIAFHLSSATLDSAEATLVRVRCGDPDPNGPGLRLREMETSINGHAALAHQVIRPGSCAIVPDSPALRDFQSFTAGCFVWPTLPGDGRTQTVVSRWRDDLQCGWRLGLDCHGHAEFVLSADGETWRVATVQPLLSREWVLLGASWDARSGAISIMVKSLDPQGGRERSAIVEGRGPTSMRWPRETPLVMAAHAKGEAYYAAFFDGKIDRPRLYAEALTRDALHRLCEAYTVARGRSPSDRRLEFCAGYSN